MSFKPWVTIPAEDVRIDLPLSLHDKDIRIMFRNAEVINDTIAQLENLKQFVVDNESVRLVFMK